MNKRFTHREKQEGIALLITLLLMGVLLSIGTSLMNITLKQYQFSGLALASEAAFQAANAGMECALYHDFKDVIPTEVNNPATYGVQSVFDVPGGGLEQDNVPSINCMEGPATSAEDVDDDANGQMKSGEEQLFQFTFGDPDVCTEISVYKFFDAVSDVDVIVDGIDMRKNGDDCPAGGSCTVIQSRGYNVACNEVGTNPRAVEREYTQVY